MNLRNPWLLLLLMLVLTVLVQLVLPWWSMAVVAFVLGFALAATGQTAFWVGFVGVALSWVGPAAWLSYQNNNLLAQRVAQLLPLGGSAVALIIATGVVAGLVGGLAALAGVWLRQALSPARQPE
ncbi:hypothetical protein IC235_15580 [Hymenobacter sp. BT664]|uniref:Uncharacterized protein n=1 Tax=Hymenobacter montanus TaxID=2771359 RepID=A0A927BFN9_9BACT|nr:hypothetical protein [Hymenobacter montanus]MBD2769309.1 hypothetical protein [Hymenobacter montanus]